MSARTWHSLAEYRALRAMIEGRTTTSAARRLGLSQSAVSRALSSLESHIGTALFERDGGRLTPTAAAISLNKRLDGLFQALERIDQPLETDHEVLRVIAPPSFTNPYLTGHIARFLTANPDSFIRSEFGTSNDVITGMVEDLFDLGMIGVDMSRVGVNFIPFRRVQATCAMPMNHPLASAPSVEPRDLDGQNLIVLNQRHARRAQLDKLLSETGTHPRLIAEVSNSTSAIELVKNGLGLTIVNPFPAIQVSQPGIVFRPFLSPIQYQIYFTAPSYRPLSRIASRFIRHVRLHTPKDAFSFAV